MRIRDRRLWPRPSPEFTDKLVSRLGTRRSSRRARAALAAGFATVGLLTFAGLGGVSSAMSGVSGTLDTLKNNDGPSASERAAGTRQLAAAQAQYEFPAWVCLTRERRGINQYKLVFDRNGRFGDGWTLLVYYGQQPGPCPP